MIGSSSSSAEAWEQLSYLNQVCWGKETASDLSTCMKVSLKTKLFPCVLDFHTKVNGISWKTPSRVKCLGLDGQKLETMTRPPTFISVNSITGKCEVLICAMIFEYFNFIHWWNGCYIVYSWKEIDCTTKLLVMCWQNSTIQEASVKSTHVFMTRS